MVEIGSNSYLRGPIASVATLPSIQHKVNPAEPCDFCPIPKVSITPCMLYGTYISLQPIFPIRNVQCIFTHTRPDFCLVNIVVATSILAWIIIMLPTTALASVPVEV